MYFENFIEAADCSLKAANYLVECLENYDYANIKDMLYKMHEIEHTGDTKKHDMSAALAKAFVTPVDREDLALISKNIDDVTDTIEEILQRFYIDKIEVITEDAVTFAKKLVVCCSTMKDMLSEFENFRKPAKLHQMIIELNNAEEDCDRFYLEAALNVRTHCADRLDIIFWREIYDHMEDCADACEHVADCVDTVVMKNT